MSLSIRARALRAALSLFCVLSAVSVHAQTTVFINEFHYDNVDVDSGEQFEIAGPAGTSLAGWRIVLYNGSNGAPYDEILLSGVIPDTCGGFGTVVFAPPLGQIQNGSPDGFAMVDAADNLIQFLSYEGTFMASSGVAQMVNSVDIGVVEGGTTPVGHSLQLIGTGSEYEDFTWAASPTTNSFGFCNSGQTFNGIDVAPFVSLTDPVDEQVDVPADAVLEVTFNEAVTLGGSWYSLTCTSGAVAASVSAQSNTRFITPDFPLPNDEACTLTVNAAQVEDSTGNFMAADHRVDFTVVADLAPTIVSTTPANNASGVSLGANLLVTFSESVDATGSWYALSCADSGAHTATVSGGPTSWTINPDAEFSELEACTLTIESTLVTDLDGAVDPMPADVTVNFTTASGPGDYYATADPTNATTLRTTLHAIIDDHTCFPYSGGTTDTWDILEAADENPSVPTHIVDVYKNASLLKVGSTASGYNREHTWPNSRGFSNQTDGSGRVNCPYTDTHMLYISDIGYNSDRGNKPLDECNSGCTERTTVLTNGTGGPGQSNWFNASVFEVWDHRKGDVARAVLYMDIRYEGGTHANGLVEPDLEVLDTTSLPAGPFMGKLSTLIAWHQQDPPDAGEQLRNEVVYSYQLNRNPFIDHPEWVDCLWNDICTGNPPNDVIFQDDFDN